MTLRIALCQVNPVVGCIRENADKIKEYVGRARDGGATIIVFPELVISGYPPEDLLFRKDFIRAQESVLDTIADGITEQVGIVGFAFEEAGRLYNAAAIINRGRTVCVCKKIFLPNYGVFDEKRYFTPGQDVLLLDGDGIKIGVNICEDIWVENSVTEVQGFMGEAELVINLSSSPYHMGKWAERREMLSTRARHIKGYVAYTNLVGGQDELVFDGRSMVVAPGGELVATGTWFQEDLVFYDLDIQRVRELRSDPGYRRRKEEFSTTWPLRVEQINLVPDTDPEPLTCSLIPDETDPDEEVYRALVMGTADYVNKNGFKDVVIGVSGGIDSALVATIAVDALGKERVHGVMMPSPFTSWESKEDASTLAENLSISLSVIPIEETFEAYLKSLNKQFDGMAEDITEENLQARIRGNLLMALSNKFGWLVLTTGNKSEVSVGYSTLYGDTAGGFAVIKDLFKTLVYRLAHWRNRKEGFDLIPGGILTKPPSAELRLDQTDQDFLPPYDLLDGILKRYVEKQLSAEEITALGYDAGMVRQVTGLVDKSEYKRRQSPPGIKITPLAFGRDRRMPITNRFRVLNS